jgi:hypothetical protein
MTVRASMWWLAVIWFAGGGFLFVILVGQSLTGYYEPRTQDAWGWFLPTVMPTLALIVGALVADYRKVVIGGQDAPKLSAGPVFWLGAGLSVFYLLVVASSILLQPLLSETSPLVLMQRSNLWLGPLQGLCVAALGFFFQSKT